MNALLSDPWIAARVDEAVAPWRAVLGAEDIAWMREQLAEALATDENAARLLRGARPRVVDESGEVGTEPQPDAAAPGAERRRSGT